MKLYFLIAFVSSLGLGFSASAQEKASRSLVVVDQKALDAIVEAAEKSWEVGSPNIFAISLTAGTVTGLRIEVIPWKGDKVHLAIEALGGVGISRAGISGEFGGGPRVELVAASDHKYNALYISPGVDFMVMYGHKGAGEFLHFEPYTWVYWLTPSVDVSWAHQFNPDFTWEVIGARLGADIGLAGQTSGHTDAAGLVSPAIFLFTNFRF